MKRPASTVQWLLAAAGATAATGASLLLDSHMSVAGLAMVYLVAVIVTAMTLDRTAGIVASLLCVSALNFFFVPPRYTFAVNGAEYWWTLAVLLGLSLALNSLIANLRERRARAELGEARAAELHALGETLAQCEDHEAMARRAAQWLHERTGHACAVFLRGDDGQPRRRFGAPDGAAFHPSSALWAMDHGRTLGRGSVDWPNLDLWCAPFGPAPATGAVQVLLSGQERPSLNLLQHWQDLARQVALSVERERAAEAAQAAQQSARAELARNTLLASLSHDLRTPLAGIVGSASALRTQSGALSAEQRELLLANLENEARDLALMADNILQMARLSQPQSQLKTQWESVEEILGAAVARMRRRWRQAKIQLRVKPQLPPIRAEAALLAQVVSNLVDNAVRHGGSQPQIAIRAGRSREGVFVAVRDCGTGLPPGDPQELFERYRQGGSAGSAGLGLAICKLVVQAHGGRIEARRCEPGTEFRIDLPAQAPAEAPPAIPVGDGTENET